MNRILILPALLLLGSCASDGSTATRSTGTIATTSSTPTASIAAPPTGMPMILDYSPTVSDVGALLYLASHSDVDLLAVTLPGTGEADCGPGVTATRALLDLAGSESTLVGCGRDEPLVGDRDWPDEWRQSANEIATEASGVAPDEPIADAEELLASTLEAAAAPVTLVAVGPLTNLGVVLGDRPELATQIETLVVMGGAVDVPGNVMDAPTAEWNLYVDPEAARRTIASGVRTLFVPLDATNHVPWTASLAARLALVDDPVAAFEHWVVTSRPGRMDGVDMWDELAAMAAVDPGIVTIEDAAVSIDDDGATLRDPNGTSVRIATSADAATVTNEFLRVLAGGTLPAIEPLTADEQVYLDGFATASEDFDGAMMTVFESVPEAGGADAVHQMVDGVTEALRALDAAVRALNPPPSFVGDHGALVGALDLTMSSIATAPDHIDKNATGDAGDPVYEVFESSGVNAAFAELTEICRRIESRSVARDGPELCGDGDEEG